MNAASSSRRVKEDLAILDAVPGRASGAIRAAVLI